jgi:glycosyltransferase involved in cell wall biosynthesis
LIHLVTHDFPPAFDGGVASWAQVCAAALAALGQEVVVYARSGRDTAAFDGACPHPVVRLEGRSWARRGALWVDLQVGPLVRQGDRVIFSTWPLAVRISSRLARRGVPFAPVFHGSDLTRLADCPPGLAAVARRARALLPVSGFLRAELARLLPESTATPSGRIAVLPQPVETRELAPPGEGLVTVARLNRLKGVDRVLRLGAALGWPVTVIGDGEERAGLEALAAELGVAARFTGRLSREQTLAAYPGHAAAALLPRVDRDGSGAEGFGLVLLEAMAWGVPAIGCRTGGVPEAVGPGLLLEEPDDAAGSAAAVRGWLAGGERRREARAWVRAHHGGERTARALLEALRGG